MDSFADNNIYSSLQLYSYNLRKDMEEEVIKYQIEEIDEFVEEGQFAENLIAPAQ